MDDVVEKVASAIEECLKGQRSDGYVSNDGFEDYPLCVDVNINPLILARAAIRATLEHYRNNVSEGMASEGYSPAPGIGKGIFQTMIFQAIEELDE